MQGSMEEFPLELGCDKRVLLIVLVELNQRNDNHKRFHTVAAICRRSDDGGI